jgi:hypothetical protein
LNSGAKPRFKTGSALMQQHAEPVDNWVAAATGGGEQLGFKRNINDINDRRGERQRRQIEIKGWFA